MKKENFVATVLALFVLVLLSACRIVPSPLTGELQPAVAPQANVTETSTTPPMPQPLQEPAQPDYEITEETMAKLNEAFKPGFEMAVSEASRKMSFGSVYVFAVGIGNPNINSDSFQLKAELKKTYDKSMNPILSNLSLASTWLASNEYPIKTLKRGEQTTLPFIVEIKNLVDGAKPKPGIYEFKLTVLRQESFDYPRKEYASKTITIQLE